MFLAFLSGIRERISISRKKRTGRPRLFIIFMKNLAAVGAIGSTRNPRPMPIGESPGR